MGPARPWPSRAMGRAGPWSGLGHGPICAMDQAGLWAESKSITKVSGKKGFGQLWPRRQIGYEIRAMGQTLWSLTQTRTLHTVMDDTHHDLSIGKTFFVFCPRTYMLQHSVIYHNNDISKAVFFLGAWMAVCFRRRFGFIPPSPPDGSG